MDMKDRLVALVLAIIIALSLSSCGSKEKVDPKYCSSLVETGYDNLYYDTRTNIVYYVTYYRMTVYYCEHGIPYSFNPTTGELVCISN